MVPGRRRLLALTEGGTFSCRPVARQAGRQGPGPVMPAKESALLKRTVPLISAALIGLVTTSCAAFLANTDVSLISLGPVRVQGGAERIQASFRIVNHNSTPSQLVGILYRMDLRVPDGGWTEATEGYSVQELALPPGQPADVTFTLDGLAGNQVTPVAVEEGAYRLVGELRVVGGLGEVQVPFSFPSDGSGDLQPPLQGRDPA